jgi:FkbM family methyltransferase
MKKLFKKIVRNMGFDVVSFDPRFNFESRKVKIINRERISHVLDVGANTGQFASYLRKIGYKAKITSFEPMKKEFAKLQFVAKNDPKWTTVCLALGSAAGEATINISQNSYSSSLRRVLPRMLEAHPDSVSVSNEIVQLSTIDTEFEKIVGSDKGIMLKIDTQGFESEVIAGAVKSLKQINIVVLEMSLEPMYLGQELLPSVVEKMSALGYKLAILESCDEDYNSFSILQMDGWFVK